ncbi:hypothetical protein LPW11_00865 [Geomonas sp. RF6]|uniref:DUF4870 family protein n=1 Tax=Geomonas sp. RF6 TaxID=2897342 RepID=UPI001E4C2813|nr:hypothetical protein [Geomonas sp. RF6]UFS70755.1 hypothetical protein LPW11_00865 [Geomonas sp. RF6]
MEGMVLGFDAEVGVIRCADGTRYRFSRSDWKSPGEPRGGARVDFVAEGDAAREIYVLPLIPGNITDALEKMEKSEKTMPTIVYACYLGGFLWGVTMLIGVVIAYLYRDSATGTYRSHYDYQISIFWKSLLGFLVSFLLMLFFGLGVLVMVATYVWVIVKIVKGWRCLADGQPVAPA